jgi:hypothetical protein
VCKPASHPTLYERIALWQAHAGLTTGERRHGHGRCTAVSLSRSLKDVLLLDGQEPVSVHWVERTVVNAKTGAQLSHQRCITTHRVTAANVAAVAHAGRGRWKIAQDHNQGRKTTGDHVEHHCGPGQQALAAVMRSLNLLALLFYTVLEWSDDPYALLRQVLARRQTFFEDIRALMRSMVFDSWQHLMAFMIRGLALESRLEPQAAPKLDTS